MIRCKNEGPKNKASQVWYKPVTLTLQKLRQEDCSKLEAGLGYRVRLCLKKQTKTRKRININDI